MEQSGRVLVIGIDSADKDLVQHWAKQGHLPTFRRLMEESTWGEVENPQGFEAGTVWPSFFYGSPPGEHGQYDGHRRFDPETYDFSSYRQDELASDPIWKVLDRHGKSSILIDPPYMHVPRLDNCVSISNWGSHTPIPGSMRLTPVTHPPELAEEITTRFGEDPLGGFMCDHHQPRTQEAIDWFRRALIERIEKRTDMGIHLMQERPWDLFMSVYSECHCVGHHCWHLHDPTHREYDPALAEAVGDPLKDIYIATDKAVDRLLKACPPGTRAIVYLSHGIETGYTGTRMLDRILARLEGKNGAAEGGDVARAAMRRTWSKVWKSSPDSVRRMLDPLRKKARRAIYHEGFLPHRERRRCFEVYGNDRSAGVRINLVGREQHGIVQPGEEYRQLCRDLTEGLKECVNADTGEPLVAEVVQTGETQAGDSLNRLPDLMVTWNRRNPIQVVSSPRIGRLKNDYPSLRTGDHTPVGMFFSVGPGVQKKHLNDQVAVIDFAPSVSSLLGVHEAHFVGQANDAIARLPS